MPNSDAKVVWLNPLDELSIWQMDALLNVMEAMDGGTPARTVDYMLVEQIPDGWFDRLIAWRRHRRAN